MTAYPFALSLPHLDACNNAFLTDNYPEMVFEYFTVDPDPYLNPDAAPIYG
jgi:hypothetical protein